jgi:hypothetical protein
LRQATEIDPTNGVVAGNYYSEKAKLEFNADLDLALRDAQRAADLEPSPAMLEWLRRFKMQADILRNAQATAAARRQAYDLVQQNDYADAATSLNALIQQNPDDVWAHDELAYAYEQWAHEEQSKIIDAKAPDFDRYNKILDSLADELQKIHLLNPDGYKLPYLISELDREVISKLDDEAYFLLNDNHAQQARTYQKVVAHARDVLSSVEVDLGEPNLTDTDYGMVEHGVAHATKLLRYALHDSAALGQLAFVNENSSQAARSDTDAGLERRKQLSNCGFDTVAPGCNAAPPLAQFLTSPDDDSDGVVAALVHSIPQSAWQKGDTRIDQNIAWVAALERQKPNALYQQRLAMVAPQDGPSNPKLTALLKQNATDQLTWIAADEKKAKSNIKDALKDDGIDWQVETRSNSAGQPFSQQEIDDLRRRFGK